MLLEIKILTALDAVRDNMNITDKTDYYVKSSLSAEIGTSKWDETIINYYKFSIYRSYQYIMKHIVQTVIYLGYLVMKMAYNQARGDNNQYVCCTDTSMYIQDHNKF